MSNRALDAAIDLANRGFKVFPCRPRDKTPSIKGYNTGNATDLEGHLLNWFTKQEWTAYNGKGAQRKIAYTYPGCDANVGIELRGLCVIEVDGPEGHENAQKLKLPDTYRSISGSVEPHHYHLWFRLPPGVGVKCGKLSQKKGFSEFRGIDIKSTAGMVVGPGSVHKSGRTYKWDRAPDHVRDLPLLPEHLLELWGVPIEECGGKARKGQKKAATGLAGSDADVLEQARKRWPITGPGMRHSLSLLVVIWLFNTGRDLWAVKEIAIKWLNSFEGVYATDPDVAYHDLVRVVTDTEADMISGKLQRPTDHIAATKAVTLSPAYESLLKILGEEERTPTVNVLSLLRGLLKHVSYAQRISPGDTLKMTSRQLRAIADVPGIKPYYQFMDAFVSRAEDKADLCELLVLTHNSHQPGVPSEYRIVGPLLEAINGDRVDRHEAVVGCEVAEQEGDTRHVQQGDHGVGAEEEPQPEGPRATVVPDQRGVGVDGGGRPAGRRTAEGLRHVEGHVPPPAPTAPAGPDAPANPEAPDVPATPATPEAPDVTRDRDVQTVIDFITDPDGRSGWSEGGGGQTDLAESVVGAAPGESSG